MLCVTDLRFVSNGKDTYDLRFHCPLNPDHKVNKSRILMIHVFITDGHEIYLVVLVIYAFIANLSESQGSTALKFTWESL